MEVHAAFTTVLFLSLVIYSRAFSLGNVSHYCENYTDLSLCVCHSIEAPNQENLRFDLLVQHDCRAYILQYSNIKRIPENWLDLGEPATDIWVFTSHLKEIRQSDFRAPGCKFVDLSINDLEILPTRVFSNMPTLQKLWIKENKLRILKRNCFENLSRLYSLRLQKNELEYLDPTIFYPLTNLSELNLSHNKIKYLEGTSFMYNTRLQELNLEFNNLKIVDPELSRLSCLRASEFMRNYSDRRTSTEIFASLSKLKVLNVAANIFTYIGPTTFARNRNLEKVDMTATNLSCIAIGAFLENVKLTHIALGENDMKEVDMILFMPTRFLEYLDLRGNSLTELKNLDQIRFPRSLWEVKLRYNDFSCSYLSMALQSFEHVEKIDVYASLPDVDCLRMVYSNVCGKVRRGSRCQLVSYEF